MKKITNFDNYDHAVEHLALNSVDNEFDNEGPDHAATVLTHMMKNSNEIRIFSGTFNSDVTSKTYFMKELDKFINSGKKLYLILEDIPSGNPSNALKKVLDYSKTNAFNVEYKKADKTFINKLVSSFASKRALHFAVGDEKSYRVEISKSDYKARCNFNDPNIAERLKSIFDSYFFKD